MRAYELYETDLRSLGIYNPSEDQTTRQICNPRTSTITLRHLNKLKHIRRRNQQEREKKLKLLPAIYGDAEFDDQRAEFATHVENPPSRLRQAHYVPAAEAALPRR